MSSGGASTIAFVAERVSDDASDDAQILAIEDDEPVVLGEAAEAGLRSGEPATVPGGSELPTEAWTAATPRRQDAFVLIQCVLGALSLLSVWSSATQVALALAALLVLIALIPLWQRVRNGSGRAKVRALTVLAVALTAIAAGTITVIRLATSDPSVAPSVEVDARTFSVDSEMRTSNRTGLAGGGKRRHEGSHTRLLDRPLLTDSLALCDWKLLGRVIWRFERCWCCRRLMVG